MNSIIKVFIVHNVFCLYAWRDSSYMHAGLGPASNGSCHALRYLTSCTPQAQGSPAEDSVACVSLVSGARQMLVEWLSRNTQVHCRRLVIQHNCRHCCNIGIRHLQHRFSGWRMGLSCTPLQAQVANLACASVREANMTHRGNCWQLLGRQG